MEHDVDTDFMVRLHQVILYRRPLISITKCLSFCLIFDNLELDTDTDLALRTDAVALREPVAIKSLVF